jgi:hypothetical protein
VLSLRLPAAANSCISSIVQIRVSRAGLLTRGSVARSQHGKT